MNLKMNYNSHTGKKSVTLKWKKQMLHRIIELIAHEIGHNSRGHQFFDLGPHYQ